MRYDYRNHFPFRFKIRTKIIIPFLMISIAVAGLGVTAVNAVFRAQERFLFTGEMKMAADVIEGIVLQRVRDLTSIGTRVLAIQHPAQGHTSGADACITEDMLDMLERSGYTAEIVGSSSGFFSDAVWFSQGSEPIACGFQYLSDLPELRLFATGICPEDKTVSIYIHQNMGLEFTEVLGKQSGIDIVIFSPDHGYWESRALHSELMEFIFNSAKIKAGAVTEVVSGLEEIEGHPYSYYIFPLNTAGEVIAYCALVRSHEAFIFHQSEIKRAIILVFLLIVGFGILVYLYIISHLTRPIYRLMNAVERVGHGDFAVEVDIRTKDEIGRLTEAFRNMTSSLRENQQELQEATQKIIHQEKLASLGQMVAGIMHEIKNPLNSLGIMVELARGEDRPEERNTCFIKMEEELKRISTAVEQFLALSRRPKFALEAVNINERIASLISRMESLFTAQDIDVVTDLSKNLPLLMLDIGHIDQVLYNLIINALQAMKGGGLIMVVTDIKKEKIPDSGENQQYVRIAIKDTGVGIPGENISRIFDPFFTSKPAGEGTGLGLSIVKSVIEEYSGRVRVYNRSQAGAVAEILLPF